MSGYNVYSYHLNVDEGDCAIHAVFTNANPPLLVTSALVDGGRAAYGVEIENFLASPEAGTRGLGRFDSVIVTHWDGDHVSGVVEFLYRNLQTQVQNYIRFQGWKDYARTTLAALVQAASNNRHFISSHTYYAENTYIPVTRFYAPYWYTWESNPTLTPTASAISHLLIRRRLGFVGFLITPSRDWDGTYFDVWVDIMVEGQQGRELLGRDLFTGDVVLPPSRVPDSPQTVSTYMSGVQKWRKPVMYCIGSDGYSLCPNDRTVDYYEWTDINNNNDLRTMDLGSLVLRRKQRRNDHEVSTRLVVGTTTGNNESSIACMIIWPDPNQAKVTHYIAGDAGEFQERLFLRWATVPNGNTGYRLPIKVSNVKISHHGTVRAHPYWGAGLVVLIRSSGAKFSTPVFLPFLWQPDNIIISNSMNAQWNHPSWEIVCLLYAYTDWRARRYNLTFAETIRVVVATNLPIYLCDFWNQDWLNLYYVSPGSIQSWENGNGIDLRSLFQNRNIRAFNNLPADYWQRAHSFTRITAGYWDYISFVTKQNFGATRFDKFGGLMQPRSQQLRAVRIIQNEHNINLRIFLATYIEQIMERSHLSTLDRPTGLPSDTSRQLPKELGRDDIEGSEASGNRARRVPWPGLLSGPKTFQNLSKDDSVRKRFSEWEDPPSSTHGLSSIGESVPCKGFRSWTSLKRSNTIDTGVYLIKASDATSKAGLNTHGVATGHLDYFLGDLRTGAIVLISEPPPESAGPISLTPLDKKDETSEWFMFCMANADDVDCGLRVKASVASNGLVNMTGFEFRTKLRYLQKDSKTASSPSFSQTSVVFSAENNMYTFDAPKDKWPTISATNDSLVGPAHTICLSLGGSPSIAGLTVKISEILGMIGLESTGFLKLLDQVSGLQLDTDKGSKNAIWYTPADKHETTIRLCFKQGETDGQDLYATIQRTIFEMTKVNVQPPEEMSIKPRLIVKKTWKLLDKIYVHVQHELTFLLEVSVTSDTQKEPIQLETALIFGDNSIQWVLNFPQGHEFGKLLTFIASLFGAKELDQKIEHYLPNCNQLALRRVAYTHGESHDSLEVLVQVTFGGMALLCTLRVDFLQSGSKFGFYGDLFPETRPALLGDAFYWVPYSSRHERWASLAITPVKNSVGILEDVQVSEVGDLSKAFNALESNQEKPRTLQKSPTSLELVGLQFSLTGEEITFSATVMSDLSQNAKVPALKLLGASLDLRYDTGKKGVSNCSLATSIAMMGPDPSIRPAIWNLILAYNQSTWTLSGGVTALSGSLLYSLFDGDSNSEMAQLLSNMILDLHLIYNYNSDAKASDFTAKGTIHLGHLRLDATYNYPNDGNWNLNASLNIDDGENKGGNLLGVIGSICGTDLSSVIPDFIGDIAVNPVGDASLTSLTVVKLDKAILMLIRLQITATISIAFYQFQHKRGADKSVQAPPVKRALVFSLDKLPTVHNVPLVGSLPQPFDEGRLVWVSGGKDGGWTNSEVQALNEEAAKAGKGYPQIVFKNPGKAPQNSPFAFSGAADDSVVLKSGFHLCLLQQGEIRLDRVFGSSKPDKDKAKTGTVGEFDEYGYSAATTSPMNIKIGPVTIFGVGVDVDVGNKTLNIILDGTVKLGPIELTLIGFSLSFDLDGMTLTDFSKPKKLPTAQLDGLAVGFQKDPITIAGHFEHVVTDESDLYLGGAVVGFKEWKFEAGGYYGTSKQKPTPVSFRVMDEGNFKAFLAYLRVEGPIATIGYAEIRGLIGGFGYNTSVRMPTIDTVQNFPFLAKNPDASASAALTTMLKSGWFSNKQGQNWVAAGLTILAFQTLTVSAVVLVEWGSGIKLGVFGLATAEMPKNVDLKFAVVQLGVVATVDFDAGIMKVDGQLTPASYVLHPSCHLTGGFALYTWFGPGPQQGDWVFTIGGYHPSYDKPAAYPNPPRLGINWSYSSSINIIGGAYFAITPKMCMGGGSLHVTLTLGALYAYLDAFADFLINYRPFLYQARGGIMVGVHYTLDLWLVSIPINVDLGATITLQGPPLSGNVHVNFYVFGFDVKFGSQDLPSNEKLCLKEFYALVLQTTPEGCKNLFESSNVEDTNASSTDTAPLLMNCKSGLVSPSTSDEDKKLPDPGSKWIVRGAVFAFTLSCKFAVATATIATLKEQDGNLVPDHVEDVKSNATGQVFAKPMQLYSPLGESFLQVSIAPPPLSPHLAADPQMQASNPAWQKYEVGYSNLPTALWGQYNASEDPAAQGSNSSSLLNSGSTATTQLMASLTLYSPPSMQPVDLIAAFDVAKSMGEIGGKRDWFPDVQDYHDKWLPVPAKDDKEEQYADVRARWDVKESLVGDVVNFMGELGLGGWNWPGSDTKEGKIKVPEVMVRYMEKWWIEPPVMCSAAAA